jgi:hypothetical protein
MKYIKNVSKNAEYLVPQTLKNTSIFWERAPQTPRFLVHHLLVGPIFLDGFSSDKSLKEAL